MVDGNDGVVATIAWRTCILAQTGLDSNMSIPMDWMLPCRLGLTMFDSTVIRGTQRLDHFPTKSKSNSEYLSLSKYFVGHRKVLGTDNIGEPGIPDSKISLTVRISFYSASRTHAS
jgi:hypothetical protein